jgi:hypothetical protein
VEGTDKVMEVAGTESVLEATEIITHEIIYYSQDENCLQQEFSSMDSYAHNYAIVIFQSSFEISF